MNNLGRDAELIRAVREYTGLGAAQCSKALVACENDPLVACGYLHYDGCAINLKGQDPHAWRMRNAREYAKLLAFDGDGRIGHAPPTLKQHGPRLG